MVTRRSSANRNGSLVEEALRAFLYRSPSHLRALEFLFSNSGENWSFHNLRIEPVVATHRNLVGAEPFLLPAERFGGSQDLPLVPFIRNVVDESLRAFARTSPKLFECVGKTPISPYGSLSLSVSRWGYVDWDYIRDLDWRIFLPPELGHLSGFKSHLERTLTQELLRYKLHPVLFGKDPQGIPQVQLRETGTKTIHGFHFYLIAMKPGFVRGSLHRDGAYSPHFAYFPEGSLDEHLESGKLLWSDVIAQQREDYIDVFNQLSFNIFGENSGEDRLYKTHGWYLHKAFKWYATLARSRGLFSLEEDLLYQYEHFKGSEAELSYLARYRYYARMSPSPQHLEDVDRDLARALSVAYARARSLDDPLVGTTVSVDGIEIILLEKIPEGFRTAAGELLGRIQPDTLVGAPLAAAPARFADNLAAPCLAQIVGKVDTALIPAEWSTVFCDSYVRQIHKAAEDEKQPIAEQDIRQALAAILASLLWQASQLPR